MQSVSLQTSSCCPASEPACALCPACTRRSMSECAQILTVFCRSLRRQPLKALLNLHGQIDNFVPGFGLHVSSQSFPCNVSFCLLQLLLEISGPEQLPICAWPLSHFIHCLTMDAIADRWLGILECCGGHCLIDGSSTSFSLPCII